MFLFEYVKHIKTKYTRLPLPAIFDARKPSIYPIFVSRSPCKLIIHHNIEISSLKVFTTRWRSVCKREYLSLSLALYMCIKCEELVGKRVPRANCDTLRGESLEMGVRKSKRTLGGKKGRGGERNSVAWDGCHGGVWEEERGSI